MDTERYVLTQPWAKGEIEAGKKYLETNENLWDTAEVVLRGKSVVTNIYVKKNPILPLKELKKALSRVNRRKEMTTISVEINEIWAKKIKQKATKLRAGFLGGR